MPKQSYSTKPWDHGWDWKCPDPVAKYVKKKKYQGHTSRNPPREISDTRCTGLRGDRDNPSRTILHLWEHSMSSSEPTMNKKKKREIWWKEKLGKHSTAQQKPLRIQAKNRTARLRLGELAHSWQWLTEYPPSLKVCMWNVSWVFSWTLINTPAYFPKVRFPLTVSCQIPALSSHTWLACSLCADLNSLADVHDASSYNYGCSQTEDRSLQERGTALPAF